MCEQSLDQTIQRAPASSLPKARRDKSTISSVWLLPQFLPFPAKTFPHRASHLFGPSRSSHARALEHLGSRRSPIMNNLAHSRVRRDPIHSIFAHSKERPARAAALDGVGKRWYSEVVEQPIEQRRRQPTGTRKLPFPAALSYLILLICGPCQTAAISKELAVRLQCLVYVRAPSTVVRLSAELCGPKSFYTISRRQIK